MPDPSPPNQLPTAAVRVRVTRPALSIFMSGGLDSSTLAALATDVLPLSACRAVTAVYDRVLRATRVK